MQYWVAKAKRSTAIVAAWLQPETTDVWWTKRRPTQLKPMDRMFIWKGGDAPFLIGLGECLSVRDAKNRDGDYTFVVRYISEAFDSKLTIENLRRDSVLKDAAFLKVGPAGTLFRLSPVQGRHLESLVVRSGLVKGTVLKGGADGREDAMPDLDIPITVAKLREQKLRAHLRKERSSALRKARLRMALESGELRCEVCAMEFGALPEDLGERCCEVHHTTPISSLSPGALVRLKDLAIVCANCHRMIHSSVPPYAPEKLRQKLKAYRASRIRHFSDGVESIKVGNKVLWSAKQRRAR
jgi:hypothetical protein